MRPAKMVASSIIYASSISACPLSLVKIFKISSASQASIGLTLIGISPSFPFIAITLGVFVSLAEISLTVSFF